MNKMKNTAVILAYVLLAAILFSGGYIIGKTTMGGYEHERYEAAEAAAEITAAEETLSPMYEVKAENGKITIYKCIDDKKTPLMSDEISERVFPKEDIEELRAGVTFERLEQAQQMFENFVS